MLNPVRHDSTNCNMAILTDKEKWPWNQIKASEICFDDDADSILPTITKKRGVAVHTPGFDPRFWTRKFKASMSVSLCLQGYLDTREQSNEHSPRYLILENYSKNKILDTRYSKDWPIQHSAGPRYSKILKNHPRSLVKMLDISSIEDSNWVDTTEPYISNTPCLWVFKQWRK